MKAVLVEEKAEREKENDNDALAELQKLAAEAKVLEQANTQANAQASSVNATQVTANLNLKLIKISERLSEKNKKWVQFETLASEDTQVPLNSYTGAVITAHISAVYDNSDDHIYSNNTQRIQPYSRQIEKEPAFSYWVNRVLQKRNAIVSSVNSRIARVTHKYGIEVLTSVEHAHKIDERNDNDYWDKAIKKEMDTVLVAFRILAKGEKPPVGYTKSSGHIVLMLK